MQKREGTEFGFPIKSCIGVSYSPIIFYYSPIKALFNEQAKATPLHPSEGPQYAILIFLHLAHRIHGRLISSKNLLAPLHCAPHHASARPPQEARFLPLSHFSALPI